MNKHTARLSNGEVATRNSKTRVYTHAVEVTAGPDTYRPGSVGIARWSSSEALARKAAVNEFGGRPEFWTNVRVIPVEVVR